MNIQHVEEYLGAIYRLRESQQTPLPLPRLQEYLNYTLISIHEMVRKLESASLILYIPYRGVTLTDQGEQMATALVRRHRIWEVFLTDKLAIPWDTTHDVAGQLEHAAPEVVTEQLAIFLGDPELCPHGRAIPPRLEPVDLAFPRAKTNAIPAPGTRLTQASMDEEHQVSSISPEVMSYLQQFHRWGIRPGSSIQITSRGENTLTVRVNEAEIEIPHDQASTIWVV